MKPTQREKRTPAACAAWPWLSLLPLLLSALLLPQCRSDSRSVETAPPFALYLAVDAPDELFNVPARTPRQQLLYRATAPLITGAHIRAVETRSQAGRPEILAYFNEAGEELIEQQAEVLLDKHLVVMLNGRVISSALLMGPLRTGISLHAQVLGFPEPADEQMRALEAELRQAIADMKRDAG